MPSSAVTASRPRPTPPLDHLTAAVRDRPFLAAAAASVVVSLVALAAFTPHYETNDDVTMNLIAAGLAFADRPDEHLVFTNVVIGLPLRQLYRAAPHIPWYGMYQFATLAAAAAALTYAFLRVNPSAWQAAVAGLFLAVVVLPCMVEMQFTRTASLASFAGLALLLAPLLGASPWPRVADLAGCALLVLGSLIRFESFLLAGVVVLPVSVVAALATPARATLQRAVPVAASLAVAVALYLFNLGYYARDEGWKDFYAYNALRAKFTDYFRYHYDRTSKPAFDSAGWAEIDYWMLMNWFYADRDRYSLAKLRAIASSAPTTPLPTAGDVISGVASKLPEFPDLSQLMLAALCVPLLTAGSWRGLALPVALYGFVFAVIVLMGVSGYWVPIRVAFPLFAGALAVTALRPGGVEPAVRRGRGADTGAANLRVMRFVFGSVAAGVVLWAYFGLSAADEVRVTKRQDAERLMRELKPRPDQLFVVWREYFPYESLVIPLTDPASLRPFRCVSMSWVLPTPFTERRLSEFDISDIYVAICERPDVYVVAIPPLIQQFIAYVQEHYRRDVVFHPTDSRLKGSVLQVFQPGEGPEPLIRWPPVSGHGGPNTRPAPP